MFNRLLFVATATGAMAGATAYGADIFPTKPITLVVQAVPGGGNDALARKFAEQLQKPLGQPMIVENKSGAGGAIGAEYVARATPDGYTLLLITAGETYYKTLNPNVKFDVEKNFTPVALLASAPLILVANASLPVKTLPELVRYAKEKSDLSYASAGIGSPHHLAGEMLNKAAGINLVHVPYRGTSPAVTDLVAGQVSLAWSSPITVAPHIQSGKVKPIALADSKRLPTMPSVPTISESGYPDVKMDNWFGIVGPEGVPQPIVDRLSTAFLKAGHEAAVAERLASLGYIPILQGSKELKARISADHARYTKIAQGLTAKAP